jgi:hypothetical protein
MSLDDSIWRDEFPAEPEYGKLPPDHIVGGMVHRKDVATFVEGDVATDKLIQLCKTKYGKGESNAIDGE